jgi:hypothetical protein
VGGFAVGLKVGFFVAVAVEAGGAVWVGTSVLVGGGIGVKVGRGVRVGTTVACATKRSADWQAKTVTTRMAESTTNIPFFECISFKSPKKTRQNG